MKLVMTMMVRDERDIIVPVIEHHLDQGFDLLLVTDNASVDGTAEILQRYAELGVVQLFHDPVHRKQQGVRVTQMARRAFTEHGADWVVNGDADEFVVPVDRSSTVRQCLEATDTGLAAFTVPVVNMVGPPAWEGAGLERLRWRDLRSTEALISVGIHAQPTPNAIHRGDAEVTVSQGNHFVSITSNGQPPEGARLEVLHLPWRSWRQFEQKVVAAGRGYEASPDLRPSKNHHGMADYRRAGAGRLREAFHLRLPLAADLATSEEYVEDRWLFASLQDRLSRAHEPDLLRASLLDPDGAAISPEQHERDLVLGAKFLALEREARGAATEVARLEQELDSTRKTVERLRRQRDRLRARTDELERPAPLREDLVRVGRRTAGALRRRLRGRRLARR